MDTETAKKVQEFMDNMNLLTHWADQASKALSSYNAIVGMIGRDLNFDIDDIKHAQIDTPNYDKTVTAIHGWLEDAAQKDLPAK